MGPELPDALRLFDVSGRVALVTGASSGLGGGVARALAAAGAMVALASRRMERMTPIADEIGGRAFHCDLLDPEIRAPFEEAITGLRDAGTHIEDVHIPHASSTPAIYMHIHAAEAFASHAAMLEAVTPADMRALVSMLVRLAKEGNVAAAKEVLDRCIGKPVEADLIERLEALEGMAARRGAS